MTHDPTQGTALHCAAKGMALLGPNASDPERKRYVDTAQLLLQAGCPVGVRDLAGCRCEKREPGGGGGSLTDRVGWRGSMAGVAEGGSGWYSVGEGHLLV